MHTNRSFLLILILFCFVTGPIVAGNLSNETVADTWTASVQEDDMHIMHDTLCLSPDGTGYYIMAQETIKYHSNGNPSHIAYVIQKIPFFWVLDGCYVRLNKVSSSRISIHTRDQYFYKDGIARGSAVGTKRIPKATRLLAKVFKQISFRYDASDDSIVWTIKGEEVFRDTAQGDIVLPLRRTTNDVDIDYSE